MWGVRNGAAAVAAVAAVATSRAAPSHGTAGAGAWWRLRPPALSCPGRGLLLLRCPSCRALHYTAVLCGRNLLKKLLSKNKKKFWYNSPTLGSHLVYKPSNLVRVLELAPAKVKKEDSIRKRALNVVLFKAVRDVLSTCEAGQQAYDLCVELSKASLTSDFSVCRIYWRTTGSTEQDDYIDKVLQKCAPRIRHLLISYRVLGTVPPLLFIRDKGDAAVREIERLLATADFGPEEEENEVVQNNFSEQRSTMATTYLDTSHSCLHANLFGIDHDTLNKQIIEYKKMNKDKEIEGIGLSEQQQQQLAEIKKQKKMRWKKKAKKPFDDDITPQKYLVGKYSDDDWDSDIAFSHELEYELQELENEVDVDDRTTKHK
ncbi:putative ribosome-binding factor A, mitochondrial [Rhineura floridana]|uniref:putative ribosome-binding factor A, mitochondrial n=1 Tax=Rhineura floridana TaxID=261503 RepID=UPI002AC87F18|nr:putative ribosome-binding factor A, mitochondrial [Rhineura floridana]